jgi:hypothetical protein
VRVACFFHAALSISASPFVETQEALGGYFIFEADGLDAAIDLCDR